MTEGAAGLQTDLVFYLWTGLGVVLLVALLALFLRLRGLLFWRRAINRELALLKEEEGGSPERRAAASLIVDRVETILEVSFPDIAEAEELLDFAREIARRYHPDAQRPELQITLGRSILAIRELSVRLETLLRRPGFRRLKRVRIRHVKAGVARYRNLAAHPVGGWMIRHWEKLQHLFLLRLLTFEPLAWLSFLSNRLFLTFVIRLLLADLFLMVGRTALSAFGEAGEEVDEQAESKVEAVLAGFKEMKGRRKGDADPEVEAIRKRLAGFDRLVKEPPGLEEWKGGVETAARVIATRHFPVAAAPLEEAALGPLLERGCAWAVRLAAWEKHKVVGLFLKTRLETIFHLRNLSEEEWGVTAQEWLAKAGGAYHWLKWPVKLLQNAKAGSGGSGVALDVGLTLSRKFFLMFLAGKIFDGICHELEAVYAQSAGRKAGETPDHPELEKENVEKKG